MSYNSPVSMTLDLNPFFCERIIGAQRERKRDRCVHMLLVFMVQMFSLFRSNAPQQRFQRIRKKR